MWLNIIYAKLKCEQMQPAVSLICSTWPLGWTLEVSQGFKVHCFTRAVLSADLCGSNALLLRIIADCKDDTQIREAFQIFRARTSIAVRRAAGAYVDSKKAQATRWRHHQLVGSLFDLLSDFILPFPASLEGFDAVSAARSPDSPSVRWPNLVGVWSGFSGTRCCLEPHRLVNHQCAVV